MKKSYTVSIEVTASSKENQAAFDSLVTQALDDLKKAVQALENTVVLKASLTEVPAPAPAPAPPKPAETPK